MMINNNPTDYAEKMQRCQEYIEALEAERQKIQVFERELPLCLELVTQAIEGCRQRLPGTTTDYFNGQSECSEQISSEGPVLEQFIPMKRTFSTDEDEQQSHKFKNICNNQSKEIKGCDKSSKKSDWLRSVQLCIQTPDPPIKEDSKVSVMGVKRNGYGAFHPFKKDKSCVTAAPTSIGKSPSSAAPAAAASSTAETGGSSGGGGGGGSKSEDKEGQSERKARRCWSPELHRRFLQALQQLGGAHVATPKQIRELMKVDGLTNDEVKSHLQKYRLHTRRPTHSIHNVNNSQTTQFVVVGGIWMPPPPEYSAMATTPTPGDANVPDGIYAPRASLPPSIASASASASASTSANIRQQNKQSHSDESGSHSEGVMHSDSPATSSSTHATTASPAF